MTPEEEQKVRQIIREELELLLGSDRYTFQRHIQIFDGRNIQVGRTTGTKVGTATDQKVGFFNTTPVVQQTGVAAQKVNYATPDLDTEAEIIIAFNTTNAAINTLRTALNNLGITTII